MGYVRIKTVLLFISWLHPPPLSLSAGHQLLGFGLLGLELLPQLRSVIHPLLLNLLHLFVLGILPLSLETGSLLLIIIFLLNVEFELADPGFEVPLGVLPGHPQVVVVLVPLVSRLPGLGSLGPR